MNQLHLENVLYEANADLFAIVSKGEVRRSSSWYQCISTLTRRFATFFFQKVLKR